ncbi:MAG: argininosuccinate lyase [Phycisphaeraceae bacterium]
MASTPPPGESSKSWQGRLTADTDQNTSRFVASLDVDVALWPYDIAGSIAHATMLNEVGLISTDELEEITAGLNSIADDLRADRLELPIELEDIHMAIERALIERTGDAGRKLHTGRSRNDQIATDLRLWARDAVDLLAGQIRTLQRAWVGFAERAGSTVMPAYTHLQRAQPIVAGHAVLAYVEMLQRDHDRLIDARKRINICPLGSGAVAGTSLPLDRARTAELLGFDGVAGNSIDATSDRDFLAELLFACATLGGHLSRWAEDWIIYSSTEFAFLELSDAFCTSSSMMPQKKNADTLELIRGKSATAIGHLTGMLTLLKGLPLAYNRDLQDDKRFAIPAVDAMSQALTVAAGIADSTQLRGEHIASSLGEGFLDATALAEYLTARGVPFRTAHHVVGQLVAQAENAGKALAELPIETLQAAGDAFGEDVYEFLGAENVVKHYKPTGAGGADQLTEQLTHWKRVLDG